MDIAIMIEGQNGLNWPRWQRAPALATQVQVSRESSRTWALRVSIVPTTLPTPTRPTSTRSSCGRR